LLAWLPAQAADIGGWYADQQKAAALDKQGMKAFRFMHGDGVFFRTGWGKHWIKDNAWRFMYVYSPVPIVAATGSIGTPPAIR
jgi:kynurenine formamidase